MKIATYETLDGDKLHVTYDPSSTCAICGEPIVEASVGGTAICPWCDMGVNRDGTPWTWQQFRKWLEWGRKKGA